MLLCLFVCCLLFSCLFGAAVLSSVEKVTFCLAAPPINAKNAKLVLATSLAKRDLLFEMIAQSELSELLFVP